MVLYGPRLYLQKGGISVYCHSVIEEGGRLSYILPAVAATYLSLDSDGDAFAPPPLLCCFIVHVVTLQGLGMFVYYPDLY